MKEIVHKLRKRWIWGIGVFLLFTVGLIGFMNYRNHQSIQAADPYVFSDGGGAESEAGGTLTMRQLRDTFILRGLPSGATGNWKVARTNILEIEGNATKTTSVQLKALTTGESTVTVEIIDAAGQKIAETNITINVVFSISEYLDGTPQGAIMSRIYDTDKRKSLVLDYGAVLSFGSDADKDTGKLNLIFGSAVDKSATWTVGNSNIIQVGTPAAATGAAIQAVGAGKTTLSVDYAHGTDNWTDTIDVYVRPQITYDAVTGSAITVGGVKQQGLSSDTGATVIDIENGERLDVSVLQGDVNSKVVWAISKDIDGKRTLIRDSLGNTAGYGDDANLVAEGDRYRVDAKAGRYLIEFFVAGAYTSFDDVYDDNTDPDYRNPRKPKIQSVALTVNVKCSFEEKTIALSLGSSYNLADAFNIPQRDFEKYFNMQPDDAVFARTLLSWTSSGEKYGIVSTNSDGVLGKTVFTVSLKSPPYSTDVLPGLKETEIKVTFVVTDTFELNISSTKMAVGSTLDLHGIIGSNPTTLPSQFVWSASLYNTDRKTSGSAEQYVTLSNTDGQYATVTAQKETLTNYVVRVSLAWTDKDNTTWVAYCDITITQSITDFKILPDRKSIEAGATETLQTNLPNGTHNVLWVSSDTSIVTVEPQPGNAGARITATDKVGTVVITAINRDNDTYATCVVTVLSAITNITIKQGTSYSVSAAVPYVFLEAEYEPKNATSADLEWDSSDTSVATVDSKGMVTVLKIGQTTISVKPTYNPNGVYAQCVLTVREEPITGIKTSVSSLEMVKGEKYEVGVSLTPVNPTDNTLRWSSTKPNVATVNNGVITAVGVGTTTIMVQGGSATALIEVAVREKLTSIQFKENEVTIEEGEKRALEVIYTPAENVRKDLTYRSTDTSVATIDAKGVVTGVKEGMTMIIATANELGTAGAITCMIHVTAETIETEEFSIDPEEMSLFVGEEQQITPVYIPDDATHQEVTYTAGNEAVATVTEEGLVTAVAPGFTIITCQDVETGKTAICQVTVEPGVQFSLSPATREIAVGKSFKLKKVTVPSNAKKTATWKSSNKAIATVNSSGKVTGKKIGSCTITCTLTYYGQSATCRVKVAKLKSTVKLDKTSIRMNVGSTYRLKKTVTSNDSKLPSVKFSSKNSKVASVGANSGKITAKRVGSTYIVAKTTDASHATARCRVIVIRRATGVSLNKTYAVCYIGSTLKLKATVKPASATIKKVKWSSSDEKVAAVTGTGKITGYAEGETYISATTTDGGNKKARCLVKVMEPIETSNIIVAQTDLTMKVGDTTELSFTILPDDHTDSIKMASDNKRVATVTNSGKVKAVGTGNATITITATSGVTATVNVNVVALNKTSIRMRQYDTETLVVHGTSDPITWYSANNSIATVTNGRVVGRSVGTTYVYAYVNGCRMSCRVEVVRIS